MKICKIKWKSHPILGDLLLDFTNPQTNKSYDSIILAGENGSGKTTILSSICDFMNGYSMKHIELIEYEIDTDVYKAVPPTNMGYLNRGFYDLILPDRIRITMDIGKSGNTTYTNDTLDNDIRNIRYYGCIFSKARADFKTNQITSTKTEDLDKSKHNIDGSDDFTSLKQLIVDIHIQDREVYGDINEERGRKREPAMSYIEFEPSSKMYRFVKAFNNFFLGKIQFKGLSRGGKERVILFSKNGNEISIDNLSTGEKQIIFRGTYLLRNLQLLKGGIILVDEPELSMHPKWQEKILKYYRDLFTEGGEQKVQMFLATHSENVLRAALEDRENVLVVVLKDEGGKITAKPITAPFVLPTLTSAELNYEAFDVVSNDYHIALYGYLQTKAKTNTIKECDDYIVEQSFYDYSRHEKKSSSGRDSYQTLPTYIRNVIDHPSPGRTFTQEELRCSIELLRDLCEYAKTKP